MKVALVCDWLTEKGGAEKVLLEFHKMFPKAPIYTSQYRKGRIDWFSDAEVKTGYLNFFPVSLRRFIAPLRQNYFKKLDLSEYDLVISVTGCDAKMIKTTGRHLCYCHVPTQYYWGKREEYLKNPGFGVLNPLARVVYKGLLPKLAEKDFEASKNPDEFITISNFAKQEIKTFYKREAKTVSPPVETGFFAQVVDNYKIEKGKSQTKKLHNKTIKMQKSQALKNEQKFYTDLENVENLDMLLKITTKFPDGFYLNFSRQVNWKRLDLAVEACKNLNLPLVLVGDGPESKKLQKIAKKSENIFFIPFLKKTDLAVLSSMAKAFIFPSKEPFGIAPVEALAAGCPVIALKAGGALDFIKDGKNGLFFESQDVNSLEKALVKFETGNVSLDSPKKISTSVKRFSTENFKKNMKKEISEMKIKRRGISRSAELSDAVIKTKEPLPVKMRRALILCLPLILFFSNFPIINLGDTSSMHLELSLPLLWLLLFSILSLKTTLSYCRKNLKTPLLALPLFLCLSLLISSDKLRAILTFGVLICLFISVIGISEFLKRWKLPQNFRKIVLIESVVVAIFCLIQSLFDALGAGREATLLCSNCTSNVFGFPHPNGFAIEPQFMGSLLIAPLFLALNSLLENKSKKSQGKLVLAVIVLETTLFFTFSRGAIFATIIALFILCITLKSLKKVLKIALLTIDSLVLALVFQGSLAVLGPTDMTFSEAITSSVSQLSLGKIDFKEEFNGEFSEPKVDNTITPIFDGYVAESTDRRLELATFSTKIAFKNPTNTVFGTGLGSAGKEMFKAFPEKQGHEKEIVQNEYLETFLEIGFLGIVMLLLSVVTFLKLEKLKFEPYTFAVILAFMVSLLFFSGFPNALHIYLLPVLWYNLMYDKNRLS